MAADRRGALGDGTRRIYRLNPVELAALRDHHIVERAESPTRTPVELEHRHIDRHGPGWEAVTGGATGPRAGRFT